MKTRVEHRTAREGRQGGERSQRFMTRNNPRGEERRLWNTALCERIGALTQISHRRQKRDKERERENWPGLILQDGGLNL